MGLQSGSCATIPTHSRLKRKSRKVFKMSSHCARRHASVLGLLLTVAGAVGCGPAGPASATDEEVSSTSAALTAGVPLKGAAFVNGMDGATCGDLSKLALSWFYDWNTTTSCGTTSAEFVPQVWGDWTKLSWVEPPAQAVSRGAKYLLGFNEPDHTDQGNVTVAQAIALWPSFNQPGVLIGSPAAAGTTWLDQFMQQVTAQRLRVDFIAMHWYGWDPGTCDNVSGLEGKIQWAEQYHRPIWITELSCRNQGAAVVNKFYVDALAMFERHPLVARYSWYLSRATGEFATASLLDPVSGQPTTLGNSYISAPGGSTGGAVGSKIVAGGNYEILSVNSNKCLDLLGGAAGDNVKYDQKTCDQSNAQRFRLSSASSGAYFISNIGTGQCLDASDGWSLKQKACNQASSQAFYLEDRGGGQLQLRSVSANKCGDISGASSADGASAILWACSGANNQRWILRGLEGDLRHVTSTLCVHPLGGATVPASNTSAVLWNDCSKLDRIRYRLRNDGNIQHVSSGECLYPLGGVASSGAALAFASTCGDPKLAFRQLPNGALQHKQSGLCLQRKYGTTNNGEPIVFGTSCVPFSLDP